MMMKRIIISFLISVSGSLEAMILPTLPTNLPACASSMMVGTECLVVVSELKPTQLSFGAAEVLKRARKIRRLDGEQLYHYLGRHIAPLAVAPSGELYLLDHHHLARAMAALGGPRAVIRAVIQHNWATPHRDQSAFWGWLKEQKLLWLLDEQGRPRSITDLPASIFGLHDDPLRTLSWAARHAGAYDVSDVPHAEFLWANYFRRNISAQDVNLSFGQALSLALRLASLPTAAGLPGYRGTAVGMFR